MHGALREPDPHSTRACRLALTLAAEMAPRDAAHPTVCAGFLLHDVGKVMTPPAILTKPGPLTPDELRIIRRHPGEGSRLLAKLGFPAAVLDIVRHHHERWDGRGYPDGLAGEEIPLWARVLAVADAVDAMTSERPYQAAMPLREALRVVRDEAGRQFDPVCAEVLLSLPLEQGGGGLYPGTAALSVVSKSVRGIGPTHGEVVPAAR